MSNKYTMSNMELAEFFEKQYKLPKDKVERILFANSELQVVKFAKNRDFISQNCLANEIAKLLNVNINIPEIQNA